MLPVIALRPQRKGGGVGREVGNRGDWEVADRREKTLLRRT